MITEEMLLCVDKSAPEFVASSLTERDVADLISFLSRKEDAIRYPAFLLLQSRSQMSADVFAYWETFRKMLFDRNSYQRSIGVMLLAANARWDRDDLALATLRDIAPLLSDDKPITIRQCISSLERVGADVPATRPEIRKLLLATDLASIRETMRKLVLMDILHALFVIKDNSQAPEVEEYFVRAMTGNILDAKGRKQLRMLLEGGGR